MKKINFKYQVAAGVILIIGGAPLLLSNYIKDKRDVIFSDMNLALSLANVENVNADAETTVEEPIEENTSEVDENTYEEYLGVIDISKIGLYKGFYNKNSSLNNVKFNLYLLKESNYPDVDKGNLIIAGHSGNYNNSYFKNLYKLDREDEIVIHYNSKDYIYKIKNIYNEKKNGSVRIFRDKDKTTLTLITCTKDDSYHQTIYISELIEIR